MSLFSFPGAEKNRGGRFIVAASIYFAYFKCLSDASDATQSDIDNYTNNACFPI